MVEVTKSIEWDMGHRIPNHKGQCQYPHGHRYRLEVTLKGEMITLQGASDEGMLIDFVEFKAILKQRIYSLLDHRFLVYDQDHLLKTAFQNGLAEQLKIFFVPFIPTSENLVCWCFQQIKEGFPKNIQISKLRLYETPNNWSEYIPKV